MSPRHCAILFVLLAGLGLAAAARAATPPFSTEPPAVFQQSIAPLLTPAAAALADAESRRQEGAISSVLLDETIYWVADDGAVYRAEHQIFRADSEAAVEEVARNINPFQAGRQKIYLVLARTLPPGGEWLAVRPETVFVQSPQDQADLSIYSDTAELVVVFPQTRSGSVTEQIVLIEEPVFAIPGQLTALLYLVPNWPTETYRYVVELPAAMAERLVDTPVGAAPEPRRTEAAGGRRRFEWLAKNPPVGHDEPEMAAESERGPAVWLTTLGGWDDFADWYRGLLAGRDQLPADLAAAARGWTAEAKSPEEVVRILHRRVADDIRYTGLEFGLAGFRPKSAAEVWTDGYGDCKDKANLLRALLADQGIESSLALIDTWHTGSIETRSPDFRQFNHAILAIEIGGGTLWADPTLAFLDPGQLSAGDGERQALVIPAAGGWRFVTTPPAASPRLSIAGEVEVAADGALQGSLTIEADLLYAGVYRNFLLGDEPERLRAAEGLAGDFFPGAEIIDLAIEEMPRGLFRAKIYFSVAGGDEARLSFADGGWLETELEQEGPRRTTYFQVRDRVDLTFRYRLPAGLAPGKLPASLAVDLPALSSRAGWSCEPGECRVELRQEKRQARVEPADFPAFLQAKQALAAWLIRLPRLTENAEWGGEPARTAASDLPLMPTGGGQLRLIERKYPEGVQDDRRRAALEQVLQFFPSDRPALYEAQMQLGTLDCETDGPSGARRLREGFARYGDAVGNRLRAWGRYLLAICDGVPREEAIGLLRVNADDPAVDQIRRGWSLLSWIELVAKDAPGDALVLADRVLALPEALAADGNLAGLAWSGKARLLASRGDAGLEAVVDDALAGEHAVQIAGHLAGAADQLYASGDQEAAARLVAALEPALARHEALAPALSELRGQQAARDLAPQRIAIAGDLAAVFAESPPAWWASQPVELGDDLAAVKARLDQLGSEEAIPPFVRQTVHLLTRFPPEDDFSWRLFQVAWSFTHNFPDAPQTNPLLALLGRLPKSDVYFWEGEVLAGQRLKDAGDLRGAAAFYRRQLGESELPDAFRSVMTALLADALLAAGDGAAAGPLYRELAEKGDLGLPLVAEALLAGALLELEAGRPEAAWPLLRRLQQADAAVLAKAASPQQAAGLAKLADDEAAAGAAWATAAAWWPSWLELEKKAGLSPPDGRPLAPLLGDLGRLGREMRSSQQQGDSAGAYGSLRRLAHAARWDPGIGLELAGAFTILASGAGNLEQDMRSTAVLLLRALPPFPAPGDASRADLLLGAFLLDLQRPAEVFEPVRRLLARTPGGPLGQRGAMLLAAAAAATGEGREEAASLLAAALDDSYPREARGMAVDFLAQLYRQTGRLEDERLLLEREVMHSAIAGTELGKRLESRLEASRHGGDADVFAQVFADWAAKFELPFLGYAEPASLDDPRLAGKKGSEMLDGDWLDAEKVKIAFLAAADGGIPVSDRTRILADGLESLGKSLARQNVYRRMLRAMLDEPRFPVQLRITAELLLAMSLVQSENLPELDRLLAAASLMVPKQRDFVAAARETVEIKTKTAPEIETFLEARLAAPLTEFQAMALPDLWRALLLQGDPAAARRLEPKLEGLAIAGGDPGEVEELRLTLRRLGPELREQRAAADAMAALLSAELRAEVKKESRPAALDEVANLGVLVSLPPAACRELLLHDLATHQLGAIGTFAWPIRFLGCLGKGNEGLRRDLALAWISALERDETRAEAIGLLPAAIGFDQPLWAELLAELKRRLKADDKKSLQALRGLELQQAVRRGENVNFEDEAADLSGASLRNVRLLHSHQLLRDRDIGGARAFLAASSPADLKHSFGMSDRLELLGLLPEAPERRLVESAARRQLYESRLKALMYASWIDGLTVLRLAARLDGQASYPAAWLETLLTATDDEQGSSWLRLFDAELRQDWAAAYAAATRGIELSDLDHDNQWHLGRAAFELGKKEEARRALTLFRERSQGHPRQRDAAELLARLEGGGS